MMMRGIFAWIFLLGASFAAAEMVFEQTKVPVTAAPDARTVTVEFPFKVTAGGAEIRNYDAPCSCLSAGVTPTNPDRSAKLVWKEGEKGKVLGKFDLGNFSGTVEKAIVVNFRNQKQVQLVVEVTIPQLVKLEPATHRWTQGGSPETKVFKINVTSHDPVQIKNITSNNDAFVFELKTIKPGRVYEVHATPQQMDTPGFGVIRAETDSPHQRFKRLQMFGVVQRKK